MTTQPHALTLLAAAMLASATHAQTLNTVTVTSTRVEAPPFEVPASVDVIDGQTLRDGLPQVNLSEGLGGVPGLVLQNRQNHAQDLQLSIRGFGARSTFGIRGVRLYVDGIPATMPDGQGQSSNIDIGSIERVEILRGPFSSLYGNSSGGVMQVFTETGEGTPLITGGFAVGSDGLRRYSLKGSGSASNVDWLLSTSRFETDGYRAHSAATRDTANGKLGLQLSEDNRLTFVFNSVRLSAQDPLGLNATQFAANPQQATPQATQFNTRKTVDQTQGGVVWDRRIDANNDLRVMVYYGQRETVQFQSIPATVQLNPAHSGGVIDLARDYAGLDARWTSRLQLAGRPLELIGGISFDTLDETRRGWQNFTGPAATPTQLGVQGALRRDEANRVRNLDPYVQTRWQFADRWSFEAGVRRSSVKFDSTDRYIVAGNGNDSGAADYAKYLPVAALRYQASETLSLYTTAGRGFETPTFNELSYRADGTSGLNFALQPSVNTSVEVGAKQRVAGGLLTAAVFQTQTEDEIVTATNLGGRSTFQNAGRTLRKGAELGWNTRFSGHWVAQAAYTWLDATYRDGFCGVTCTPAGNRIPGIARNIAQASLDWAPPGGLRAGAEVRSVGRIFVNDANSESAQGYTTLALHVGYVIKPSPRWNVTAFARVDNVTDRTYAGSVIVNESSNPGRFYESAPGRNWTTGVTASYRF